MPDDDCIFAAPSPFFDAPYPASVTALMISCSRCSSFYSHRVGKQTYRAGCYTRHFRNCFFDSCCCRLHSSYRLLYIVPLLSVPSCHYYFSYSFIVNSENAFRADYTSINFTYRISFCNTFTSSSTVSSFPSRMSSATQVRI